MSFGGIVSAVGNSAPLVVELVIAFMVKDKGLRYILVASLCSVFGIITMLLGMKTVREKDYIQQSKRKTLLRDLQIFLKQVFMDDYLLRSF